MEQIKAHPIIELDYDRQPRKRWRQRLIKVFLALIVAACIWAAWKWAPVEYQRARVFYWQDQCLNYTAPPNQIVCEEDPAAVKALLAMPQSPYVDFWSQTVPATFRPMLTRSAIGPSRPAAAVRFAPCWQKLAAILGPKYYGVPRAYYSGATVFLHERTTPSGQRRLVVVQYMPVDDNDFDFASGYDIEHVVLVPGTLFRDGYDVTENEGFDISRAVPADQPQIRVFAGQVDPSDGTHFTIRYEAFGQTDTLDGRLDDSGQVTLTPRHVPIWPTTP